MTLFKMFASSMSETDRRALIILIVILVVLMLLLGLIGMGIRKVMEIQQRRVDTYMHDVTVTHVVDTPKKFKTLATKKSNRILFKSMLPAAGIALLSFFIWLFSCIGLGN